MKKIPFALFLCLAISAKSQSSLSTLSSRWSDSFVEWDLYCLAPKDSLASDSTFIDDQKEDKEEFEEEICGKMVLRWLHREDFTEWDWEWGEETGSIRQKWRDDPTQWEVRSYEGDIVTMRVIWPNDPTRWTITDNEHSFTLQSKYTSQVDEWLVNDRNYGRFYTYTLREGDPRDWAIEDDMSEEISTSMRMAFLFIATFVSTPKQ